MSVSLGARFCAKDCAFSGSPTTGCASDASFAIDYAIASIEQAKLAAFDAISARLDAEAAKAPRKTTA